MDGTQAVMLLNLRCDLSSLWMDKVLKEKLDKSRVSDIFIETDEAWVKRSVGMKKKRKQMNSSVHEERSRKVRS